MNVLLTNSQNTMAIQHTIKIIIFECNVLKCISRERKWNYLEREIKYLLTRFKVYFPIITTWVANEHLEISPSITSTED